MTTGKAQTVPDAAQAEPEDLLARLAGRSLVLVGMMGAGKSSVGRRLASRLGVAFVDADTEIERAAGQTIPEIFETHGEAYFRDGEKRVIERILRGGPLVLATGGGAYMDAETRAAIAAAGISIWLKADADILFKRVKRRSNRPLLRTADPEGTLKALIAAREPTYALADITILSRDVPHETVVEEIVGSLGAHLAAEAAGKAASR